MEPATHASSNGSLPAPPAPYVSSASKDPPPARAIATGRASVDLLGSGRCTHRCVGTALHDRHCQYASIH